MNVDSVTAAVVGDVGLVVVASAALGSVARRLGQPVVVGQIVAGIALGPTLLGRLPGDPTAHLFPAGARPFLSVLSQVAIVIFMFVAGYEIDLRLLRGGSRSSAMVAAGALLVPMGLCAAAVGVLHGMFASVDPHHADGHSFLPFMAVAASITALPVLAAIVRERGIASTRPGTVALTAAGLMDVAAWVVLAGVLAGKGQPHHFGWPMTLLLVCGFTAALFLAVRPALAWWVNRPGAVLANQLPVALGFALGSAWVTASLGLHPVFGGFLAGLAMPRRDGMPDADVLRPMEQSADLLLPLFFVTTGLSFNIGAIGWDAILLLAVLLLIAVGGKLVPAYAAARLTGMAPRQSALVASLVNTRGLTELIALNVGLSVGVIGGELFTVLVLMALVTTLMTGPALEVLSRRGSPGPEPVAASESLSEGRS
jgi:Kef-type K+ transport system membrane component KefB